MQLEVIPLMGSGYIFFLLLGQTFAPLFTAQHTSTPHNQQWSAESDTKLFAFLLSPLVGAGLWSSLSLLCGLVFAYNTTTLGLLLLGALLWTVYASRARLKSILPALAHFQFKKALLSRKRQPTQAAEHAENNAFRRSALPANKAHAFFPNLTRDRWLVLALLVVVGVAYVTMLPLFEWVFDGGMYFGFPIYDHTKAALVDSIARTGIPPLSPYLADGGVPVPVLYYYGWHALAAQFCLFAGVSGYLADVAATGLTSLLTLSALCAFAIKLSSSPDKGRVILLTALFALFSCPPYLHAYVAPLFHPDIVNPLSPGFWGWLDDSFWCPQHMFAGSLVLAAIYLASRLFEETDAARKYTLAVLLGMLLATSFYSSVFAGLIAAALFSAAVLLTCVFDRELRKVVKKNIAPLGVAAGVSAGVALPFLLYVITFSAGTSLLNVGIFPSYVREGVLPWLGAFFHFYGLAMVWRFGLPYVLGVAFLFTRTSQFGRLLKILCLSTMFTIFFVHSNYYSNDFSWRVPASVENIILVFAAVLTDRLLRMRKYAPLIGVPMLIGYFLLVLPTVYKETKWQGAPAEARKVFTAAKDGWEVVRQLTAPSDMVLSNPDGFAGLYSVAGIDTNVFFALYAQRGTPIADLVFTETYSTFYDKNKLKARYARVKRFFEGSPSQTEVQYIAQDLKVKAILITPLDGLWNNPGELSTEYTLAQNTSGYRVYLRK